jgi:hypothetical protein
LSDGREDNRNHNRLAALSRISEISLVSVVAPGNKSKNVYVWDFNAGHHADVSIGLKLEDTFDSLDFLKGA